MKLTENWLEDVFVYFQSELFQFQFLSSLRVLRFQ